MDFREHLFTAVDNSDLGEIDHLFSAIDPKSFEFMSALFAIQRACDQQNLEAVRSLLPYATEFFFEGQGPRDPNVIRTMELKPYDTFFELLHLRVIPSNNTKLFDVFVPLILNNINAYERANILVQCYNNDRLKFVDCVLPRVEDLSGFEYHKPTIKEFFEHRKAKYQKDTIMGQIDTDGDWPPPKKI